MIKKFRIILLVFFCIPIETYSSEDVSIISIVNNCSSCHSANNQKNMYVPSIESLSKKEFILKMKKFRKINKSTSMYRISKALSIEDINKLAKFYFD